MAKSKNKNWFLILAVSVIIIVAILYFKGDIGPGKAIAPTYSDFRVSKPISVPTYGSPYVPPSAPTSPVLTAQFTSKAEFNQLANTVNSFNSRITALETKVAGIESTLMVAGCCVPLTDSGDPIIEFACKKQGITSETCTAIPDCKWIC